MRVFHKLVDVAIIDGEGDCQDVLDRIIGFGADRGGRTPILHFGEPLEDLNALRRDA